MEREAILSLFHEYTHTHECTRRPNTYFLLQKKTKTNAYTALFDWITTATTLVAVLTGLNSTIFLLILYQRALPALPISIAFGLLFYFTSSITLVPFLNLQLNWPARISGFGVDAGDALWVGRSGGAGMVYI